MGRSAARQGCLPASAPQGLASCGQGRARTSSATATRSSLFSRLMSSGSEGLGAGGGGGSWGRQGACGARAWRESRGEWPAVSGRQPQGWRQPPEMGYGACDGCSGMQQRSPGGTHLMAIGSASRPAASAAAAAATAARPSPPSACSSASGVE